MSPEGLSEAPSPGGEGRPQQAAPAEKVVRARKSQPAKKAATAQKAPAAQKAAPARKATPAKKAAARSATSRSAGDAGAVPGGASSTGTAPAPSPSLHSAAAPAPSAPGRSGWRVLSDPSSPALVYAGVVAVVAGFALVFVAWSEVAAQSDVWRQMPFVLSSGFPGLGLIMTGLVLASIGVRRQEGVRRQRQMAALIEALRSVEPGDG